MVRNKVRVKVYKRIGNYSNFYSLRPYKLSFELKLINFM